MTATVRKPACDLAGIARDSDAIAARVAAALVERGWHDLATEFWQRSWHAATVAAVLDLANETEGARGDTED